MGRAPVQRYKDVDLYVSEIEDVYEVALVFAFTPIARAGIPMARMTIHGYDKDDSSRATGPLLYVAAEVPSNSTYKQQQAIIRALTEITRQCFELACTRSEQGHVPGASLA